MPQPFPRLQQASLGGETQPMPGQNFSGHVRGEVLEVTPPNCSV
jgi:hypothetical protein